MPAGFLFSINSDTEKAVVDTVRRYIDKGMYSTLISTQWNLPAMSTLGDYINMSVGDNVYFFGKRMIFGIGEIVDALGTGDAAFEVYKGASSPRFNPPKDAIVTLKERERTERWGIVFKPSPHFFLQPIDMDDLLNSKPSAFRSLRTFQKRSFIQLDDEENAAFKAALIRKNEEVLNGTKPIEDSVFPCRYQETIRMIHQRMASQEEPRPIKLNDAISEARVDTAVKKEMLVEIALLHAIKHNEPTAVEAFGKWDYIAHQVAASPFKPIDYMDKIDVFAYRWITGYRGEIISKYAVIEIKKGEADLSETSSSTDYDQLMKYVDWVCDQYAHGDYSMIEAYLVANSFSIDNHSRMKDTVARSYVTGHNATTHYWDQFHLVEYRAHPDGTITFHQG